MSFSKVAVKYASTLYSSIDSVPNFEKIYQDAEGILSVFDENSNLKRIIGIPVFKDSDKLAILLKIFSGKIDESLTGFIEFLAKKERISNTYEIFEAFLKVSDKARGYQKVEISSAFEFGSEESEKIQKELEEYFKCKLKVTVKTDPGLVGGFVARTDEIIIDASVKNQLNKLRKTFSRAGVSLNNF
ncbi:F0F1 ATP synthase subunit delta [Ignavibacteriales bacterium]